MAKNLGLEEPVEPEKAKESEVEQEWQKFGPPLIGPAGGGEPVKESQLTWPEELEK